MTKYYWVITLFFLAALAAVFQYSSPNIADPDGFYHLAHAQVYRTEGMTFSKFPWTQFSAIKEQAADLWYGFHIILIPFSGLGVSGIKIASVFITFIALAGLWILFKRFGIRWPVFWTVFVFISAPNMLHRFLMLRPHLLSMVLGLAVLLFFTQGNIWLVFISAFFLTWLHLSLIWVGFLAAGAAFVFKIIFEKKWLWREVLALLLGTVLGWLARPNPLGSVKLVYVQIIELVKAKQMEASLLFGSELFPFTMAHLFEFFSGFLFIWLASTAVFAFFYKKIFSKQSGQIKTLLFSNIVLSVIFFAMVMVTARRAHDFWVVFGMVFIGLTATIILQQIVRGQVKNLYIGALSLAFLFSLIYVPYRASVTLRDRGTAPEQFRTMSEWLNKNSNPGEIVFNAHWSDFPALFFWNQKNYYIGGMDPIFQYAYDRSLYWKFHYLSTDMVSKKTCGATACTEEMLEDTYKVLKNDFRAKYVFTDNSRNPVFYSYLASAPDLYQKKFETGDGAVFLVK